MRNMGLVRWGLLVGLLFGGTWELAAQERFALVIGNSGYTAVGKLKNPANDAADMAVTLKALGFEVETVTDAGLGEMEDAVIRLGNKLGQSKNSYGFFFYAGHGVQSGGSNYLIPVDADIRSESFLKSKALPMNSVLDTLAEAKNSLNVVVLDACRNNPFGWARSSTRGLSVVGSQPAGSIIAYATSAGSTALDGTGRNGLFTSQLLKNLRTPGLEIKEVFNRTGNDVMVESGNKQVPAVYTQYFKSAFLAGGTQAEPKVEAKAAPPVVVEPAVVKAPAATEPPSESPRGLSFDVSLGWAPAVGYPSAIETSLTNLRSLSGVSEVKINLGLNLGYCLWSVPGVGGGAPSYYYLSGGINGYTDRLEDSTGAYQISNTVYGIGLQSMIGNWDLLVQAGPAIAQDEFTGSSTSENDFSNAAPTGFGLTSRVGWNFNASPGFGFCVAVNSFLSSIDSEMYSSVGLTALATFR